MKAKVKPKAKKRAPAKPKRPEQEVGLFSFKVTDDDEPFVFKLNLDKPTKRRK